MVENGGKHTPAHALAEFDQTSGEAVAGLGQILDRAAGSVVATGDGGEGDFVAEIAQLEGCIGTAVDSGLFDLGGGIFLQRASCLDPTPVRYRFIESCLEEDLH